MDKLLDAMLVVVLLLNFLSLGTTRIRTVIHIVAGQGVLLGLMPLLVYQRLGLTEIALMVLTLAAVVTLKGVVIPRMLHKAMREVAIRRDVEPMIGLIPSVVLGAVGAGLAIVLARRLPLIHAHVHNLLLPASLATVFTGFLFITTRLKAITQVVGYLILENGIFLFGLLLLEPLPFLVEIGVLLDLFVCIFVMGIILNHIHREFASLDTDKLSALKE